MPSKKTYLAGAGQLRRPAPAKKQFLSIVYRFSPSERKKDTQLKASTPLPQAEVTPA
jgi:hypothetical protein